MNCPPFETLSAFADGQADAAETAAMKTHLAACAACSASLSALGSARRALAAYSVPPAPAGLAARILAAAAERRPWWRVFLDELSAGLAQPAGAAALAAVGLAVFFALRGPAAPVAVAEAEIEVPAEVLSAAHRRYALSMPLAPVESARPAPELRLAGGPEERDVY